MRNVRVDLTAAFGAEFWLFYAGHVWVPDLDMNFWHVGHFSICSIIQEDAGTTGQASAD